MKDTHAACPYCGRDLSDMTLGKSGEHVRTCDGRDYANCSQPNGDPETTPGATCGAPIQATVERWVNVLEDGTFVHEPVGGASGGIVRLYCAEDHQLGQVDFDASDNAERIAAKVRETLADADEPSDDIDVGDNAAILGSERSSLMDDRD